MTSLIGLDSLVSVGDVVMDFAADYFGATIASRDRSELREILFDVIPRRVSIDASEARCLIEDSRNAPRLCDPNHVAPGIAIRDVWFRGRSEPGFRHVSSKSSCSTIDAGRDREFGVGADPGAVASRCPPTR